MLLYLRNVDYLGVTPVDFEIDRVGIEVTAEVRVEA
jgi:hypothetical protein